MARELRVYRDFSGGLTEAAPDIMLDNELVEAKNAVPDERGAVSKCKGTVRVNSTAFDSNPVELLIEFGKSDGTIIPLAFSGTTVRKWDGTVLKSDLPGIPTDWDIYNDVLYWLDGTNFWQYDGTTIQEVPMYSSGDPTTWDIIKTCNFIEQRGQRHFFAKKNKNELYYSEIGNINYIQATNVIKAITDDADFITGLKEYAGALLVFKRNAIFGWFGYDPTTDVQFQRIMVHKGAVSNRTIERVENYLFYMADDGVYALYSLYPTMISSVNITDNRISKVIRNAINKDKACAVYYESSYRLSISTEGTSNNLEYRFYPKLVDDDTNKRGVWFGEFTHPVACYLVRSDGKLYSGSPTDGLIFKHESGYNYDSQPIHFKVTTKPFDLAQRMVVDSKVKKLFVASRQYVVESSTIDVTAKIDYGTIEKSGISLDESLVYGEGVWGDAIWGWVDFVTKEIKLSGKGKRVQVTIENNTLDQPVTIYGVAFQYKPRKADGTNVD